MPPGDGDAVLLYARAAGERASSQGAHREAAAQYARALRYAGNLPPGELGGLLERRAQECYLTDQIDEAVAAQERALECYRELGDRASEAAALCRLSGILWCPGRIAESERAGREALTAVAGLEPGRELALAYANLAALAWWEDRETALVWATRASELAERIGDTEILFETRSADRCPELREWRRGRQSAPRERAGAGHLKWASRSKSLAFGPG